MAGQGFHYGLAKLFASQTNKEFSDAMRVGVLMMDAMNAAAGSRRCSHFTGGAGCILPQYTELRQVGKLQSWDSGFKKSYLVDPRIDMRLFEAANIHIPEGDYKDGIRMHLLGDRVYDHLVQTVLFDVSRQSEGIIIDRATGREMDGATFRKEIYASYPLLDQYLMQMAGVTETEIEEVKVLLRSTLAEEHAAFLEKYINWNPDLEWHDTAFFKKDQIDELIREALIKSVAYLNYKK
jgi:hypothetical protein